MTDKNMLRIFSCSIFAALVLALIIPIGVSGRIAAAILLLPIAVLMPLFVKKRAILRLTKEQVLLLMAVIALLYVMFYYLSGIFFGFYKNPYRLTASNFFEFFLPTGAVILFTEVIRHITLAHNDKVSTALCWMTCVVAEMLICSNLPSVTSFNRFMNLVSGTLLPAMVSNFLFHYLSRRYGIFPNLAYRLITTLHAYTLPITVGMSDALLNFFRLLIPIAIYYFIDAMYESKPRYAQKKHSRFSRIASYALSVLAIVTMLGTIMLISNHFYYGAYVIATESMAGELDIGDVAISEKYDDQIIQKGQVIAFKKSNAVIVHRVVDIQIINGEARYTTKGDANEDVDMGYVVDSQIVGIVDLKVPFLGYPTLWLRSLFKH